MSRLRRTRVLIASGALLVASLVVPGSSAQAISPLSESFGSSTLSAASSWTAIAGNDHSGACLTGRNSSDGALSLSSGSLAGCGTSPESPGALRLVQDLQDQNAAVLYNSAVATTDGLDISFKVALWGAGWPGDGMTFFLKDGANATNSVGATGGSLGYSSGDRTAEFQADGVPAALLGIGFDRYGNFSNENFSGTGCTNAGPEARYNSIAVRGAGNGTEGYCYITGTYAGAVDYSGNTRLEAARQVRIVIDPSWMTDPQVKIYFSRPGQTVDPILQFAQTTELKAASTFKFGFAASTGGATINADVWDLKVTDAAICSPIPYLAQGASSTVGKVSTEAIANDGTPGTGDYSQWTNLTANNAQIKWEFAQPVSELRVENLAPGQNDGNLVATGFGEGDPQGTELIVNEARVLTFTSPVTQLRVQLLSPDRQVLVRVSIPTVTGACKVTTTVIYGGSEGQLAAGTTYALFSSSVLPSQCAENSADIRYKVDGGTYEGGIWLIPATNTVYYVELVYPENTYCTSASITSSFYVPASAPPSGNGKGKGKGDGTGSPGNGKGNGDGTGSPGNGKGNGDGTGVGGGKGVGRQSTDPAPRGKNG